MLASSDVVVSTPPWTMSEHISISVESGIGLPPMRAPTRCEIMSSPGWRRRSLMISTNVPRIIMSPSIALRLAGLSGGV